MTLQRHVVHQIIFIHSDELGGKSITQTLSCADPESFVIGGSTLATFFFVLFFS